MTMREAFDSYISKYGHYNHIEQILNHTKKQYRIMFTTGRFPLMSGIQDLRMYQNRIFAYLLDIKYIGFLMTIII